MSTNLCCGIALENVHEQWHSAHHHPVICSNLNWLFTPTIKLRVRVFQHTRHWLLGFWIQTDKTQRHSGATCFHVLWTKCMNLVGLTNHQMLCLFFPFTLYQIYYIVMHRQDPLLYNQISRETMHAQTHGKHRCRDICEFRILYKEARYLSNWSEMTDWLTV